MRIQLNNITIMDRIRQDNGDLQALMKGIRDHGLMNPITVMENDGHYVLIAGYRRMSAVQAMGETEIEATVLSPVDAEEQLRLEIEENENRKEFTDSEKVAYGKKLRVIEEAKSRKRMGGHNKPEDDSSLDKNPTMEHGTTRDIIAKKVGYNNGRQLERATFVADNRPDLMAKVDAKEMTIGGAYAEAKGKRKKLPENLPEGMGIVHGLSGDMLGHIGSEFNRPDGFPFVLEEFQMAAHFYLKEIGGAVSHYGTAMQSDENSAALADELRKTFQEALDMLEGKIHPKEVMSDHDTDSPVTEE